MLFPAGRYVVSGTNILPSNTHVLCDNAAIVAAPATRWPPIDSHHTKGGISSAFLANSGTNFEVSGCQFKFPYRNPNYGEAGYAHILQFVGVSHVHIHDNVFDGGGDAVAEIGTTDTWEVSNRATNVSNVCYDHWGGFTDAHTNGNYCTALDTHGGGVAGIAFTGIATGGGIANSVGFEARDNVIYMDHNNAQCIEINGHKSGGTDNNGQIIGNRCLVTGGHFSWGILVTGNSVGGIIKDNLLEGDNGAYSAVGVYAPAAGWRVIDNAAINWNSGKKPVFQSTETSGEFRNNNAFASCAEAPDFVRSRCLEPPQ